jgi:hypothetical protein
MLSFLKNKLRPTFHLVKPLFLTIFDVLDFHGVKIMKKNVELKGKYAGQRCFLLGTGASIEHIDIKKLGNENTMGISQIIFNKDIMKVKLKMFFRSAPIKYSTRKQGALSGNDLINIFPQFKDPYYVDLHIKYSSENDREVHYYKELDKILVNDGNLFLNVIDNNFVKHNNLFKKKRVYFIRLLKNKLGKKNKNQNDFNYSKRVPSHDNHLKNAIILLMHMGFKEIYLCGAGYTYRPRYQLHFYDNYIFPKSMGYAAAYKAADAVSEIHNLNFNTNITLNGLLKKNDNYIGIYTTPFDNNKEDNEHRLINSIAIENGVKIFNITPDGFESPIYEKISWNNVLMKLDDNTIYKSQS